MGETVRHICNITPARAAVCAILALSVSITSATADSITDQLSAFAAAYNNNDWTAVGRLHADDAAAIPPSQTWALGRAAVVQLWKDYRVAGISELTFASTNTHQIQTLAHQIGTYQMKVPAAGADLTVSGNFLAVWQQDNSRIWQIKRLSWNVTPR